MPVRDLGEALIAAELLARPIVVATSVPHGVRLGTLLLTGGEAWLASTPKLRDAPRGAGDLLSALFLGQTLAGEAPPSALERAVRATYHVLRASVGADEMHLIAEQQALAVPPIVPEFTLEKLDMRRRVFG